jgi:hypothetical protein
MRHAALAAHSLATSVPIPGRGACGCSAWCGSFAQRCNLFRRESGLGPGLHIEGSTQARCMVALRQHGVVRHRVQAVALQVPLRGPAGARHAGAPDRQLAGGAAPPRVGDRRLPPPVRALLGEMSAARADAGQHQVQRRADPAGAGRRPGQAGGGRGAARPGLPRHGQGGGEVRAGRLEAMLNVHGQGRCAITLDPRTACPASSPTRAWCRCTATSGEPLQQLAQVLEHYMLQSEQLDTGWCWPPTTRSPPAC